jgi:hypothetical protein
LDNPPALIFRPVLGQQCTGTARRPRSPAGRKWQDPTIAALSTVLIAFAGSLVAIIALGARGPMCGA